MAEGWEPKPILANVKSLELVTQTVTTGATGNVSCGLVNDGKTVVFGGYCSGKNAVVIPFVSGTNTNWYVKVLQADDLTDQIKNEEVYLRYYVLRMN